MGFYPFAEESGAVFAFKSEEPLKAKIEGKTLVIRKSS
jgi:hypothetical protein